MGRSGPAFPLGAGGKKLATGGGRTLGAPWARYRHRYPPLIGQLQAPPAGASGLVLAVEGCIR